MVRVDWHEKFSVGVEAFDTDHRTFIGLINRLHDSWLAGDEQEALEQTFMLLMGYAEDHFRREEEMMERTGYPELEPHRDAHASLLDEVRSLRDRHASRGRTGPDASADVYKDLCDLLEDWLQHHILLMDMAYRAHFEAMGLTDTGEGRDDPDNADPSPETGSAAVREEADA